MKIDTEEFEFEDHNLTTQQLKGMTSFYHRSALRRDPALQQLKLSKGLRKEKERKGQSHHACSQELQRYQHQPDHRRGRRRGRR